MNIKQRLAFELIKALDKNGAFVNNLLRVQEYLNKKIERTTLMELSEKRPFMFDAEVEFNGQQIGRTFECYAIQGMQNINGFQFMHFKEDQKHKDFTCIGLPKVLPRSLRRALDEFHEKYPNIDITDSNFFSIEMKCRRGYNNVVGNKALFKNKKNKKEQNSFYICINYDLNWDKGYPQIDNIQIRFMYIDKEMWSWSSSGSGATVTFSKHEDRIVGIHDGRKYNSRTEKYRLAVHPQFK